MSRVGVILFPAGASVSLVGASVSPIGAIPFLVSAMGASGATLDRNYCRVTS